MAISLMLVAFAVGGAGEPMEASLCDVWPLAAGNVWVFSDGSFFRVIAQEDRNGYTAWRMMSYVHGFVDISSLAYWVRVDGWLYQTTNAADLDALPEIVGSMRRVLPEVFRDGETFTLQAFFGLSQPLDLTPVVSDEGVRFYSAGEETFYPLTRGVGPCIPSQATIVGTCSNLPQITISVSPSQWVETGRAVRLTVPESSGLDFQWYKNGVPIQDASTNAYAISEAELEDSADYKCRISDTAKTSYDTRTVTLTVFPEGSLPLAGTAGLAALAFALVAMTYAQIHRSLRA